MCTMFEVEHKLFQLNIMFKLATMFYKISFEFEVSTLETVKFGPRGEK